MAEKPHKEQVVATGEKDRIASNAGVGLGTAYDHANISAATSPSQAEINRIAKGIGIGAGSAVNFSGASAPNAAERVNEDNRAGKGCGIAAGSVHNPA